MTTYTLTSIYRMPTQAVRLDGEVVGYLYAPDVIEARWELWARQGCAHLLPAGLGESGVGYFATREAAMAFLGLPAEQGRAAA